jgi:hypothetical protein
VIADHRGYKRIFLDIGAYKRIFRGYLRTETMERRDQPEARSEAEVVDAFRKEQRTLCVLELRFYILHFFVP